MTKDEKLRKALDKRGYYNEDLYNEILDLFGVSQQRELLLDYEIYNASEDDKKNNMKYLESLVDTYLSNNCG